MANVDDRREVPVVPDDADGELRAVGAGQEHRQGFDADAVLELVITSYSIHYTKLYEVVINGAGVAGIGVAKGLYVAGLDNVVLCVGLRPTRQRLALARLLLEGGDRHVSAEALHQEAQERNNFV